LYFWDSKYKSGSYREACIERPAARGLEGNLYLFDVPEEPASWLVMPSGALGAPGVRHGSLVVYIYIYIYIRWCFNGQPSGVNALMRLKWFVLWDHQVKKSIFMAFYAF
jgi:hypothetical protein